MSTELELPPSTRVVITQGNGFVPPDGAIWKTLALPTPPPMNSTEPGWSAVLTKVLLTVPPA